jgi:para-aminobenzoate synthetase component 1
MRPPSPRFLEIPYRADSEALFSRVADRPGAVLLDSGRPRDDRGRFDIIACEPRLEIRCRGGRTTVRGEGGLQDRAGPPLEVLREALGPIRPGVPGLPFAGGAIGYFGYDLGHWLDALPTGGGAKDALPEMAVGVYDWALVVDHVRCRSVVVDSAATREPTRSRRAVRRLVSADPREPSGPFKVHREPEPDMALADYARAFRRIQDYIRDGDCYQVNFARRFSAPAEGDPWTLYQALRRVSPAPFSAYLHTADGAVLCSSPERFLHLSGSAVETCPIKGTRPRRADPRADRRAAAELRASAKDRAENLMIVDLLRNDLGRVCATGSIRVPDLFEVQSYAHVHHLVSRVTGRLAPGRDALDLLSACFPGGSVTGAPKRRAMEVIAELEPKGRGVYCGSIGYIGWDGAMDTNIAIRTMAFSDGLLRFWVGGGIVADSVVDAEFAETADKASGMIEAARALLPGGP